MKTLKLECYGVEMYQATPKPFPIT